MNQANQSAKYSRVGRRDESRLYAERGPLQNMPNPIWHENWLTVITRPAAVTFSGALPAHPPEIVLPKRGRDGVVQSRVRS